jgi:peptide/nickel transport system substrate-binding protein
LRRGKMFRSSKQTGTRTILILVLTIISISISAACAAQPSSPSASPAAQTTANTPQYGGALKILIRGSVVNIGYPGEPGSLQDMALNVPCIESLVRIDEKGVPVPFLAAGWKWGDDLKSITFDIRKGVKFHDGTDFNAAAVKYIFDITRQSSLPDLKAVTSIDVIDDYTVRLNLREYQAQLLNSLCTTRSMWIISPTAVKTYGKDYCMTHPVGTGPFKFKSFQRDVSLAFDKFDGYWQKGKPYVDSIEFRFFDDATTQMMSFISGEAQMYYNVSAIDVDKIKGNPKYVVNMAPASVTGLVNDSSNPKSPFSDIRIRRAVGYALDTASMLKVAGYGTYKPCNQIFPSACWAFNPNVTGFTYNPEKAKQLVIEAGYPNGLDTKIYYDSTVTNGTPEMVQSYLSKVGINAKLEKVTSGLFAQYQTNGWENAMLSNVLIQWSLGSDPGSSMVQRFTSKGVYNKSVLYPKDYEEKVIQANREVDFQKRVQLLQEANKMIIDDYALMIPYWQENLLGAVYANVKDAHYRDYWSIQWIPENVWLAK